MTMWLKQSTAVTIKFGPFLDSTDGNTVESGLTISQADIRLSKNGGNIAQSNNATGATHDELGFYDVPLDTTDTNTLGTLRVIVHESGALSVWQDFMVVPANVWDSFFGADALQVHANEITAGLITAAAIATGAIDADAIADNAIDAGAIAADAITAAKIASDAITAAKLAADVTTEIQSGLATAAALTTVDTVVDAIKLSTDNLPSDPADASVVAGLISGLDGKIDTIDSNVDSILVDTGTTLQGELDAIESDIDAIKAVTDKLDDTLEDDGGTYRFTENALEEAPTGGSAPTAGEIADAVWDEATTSHTTSGTFGEQLKTDVDAILEDTGTTLQGELDAIEADVDAILVDTGTTLDGKINTIDTNVDSILADTGTDGVVVNASSLAADAANEIADALLDRTNGIETSYTLRQALRLILSACAGKASGLETTTAVYRDVGDSKDRITATVDEDGNRTAVTLDAT